MQIIKNAPIPPKAVGRSYKYPFDQMEPGDSILDAGAENVGKSKVASAASRYAKKNLVTFESRAVEGGVQVWRTA